MLRTARFRGLVLLGFLIMAATSYGVEGNVSSSATESSTPIPESTVLRSRFKIYGEMPIFANRAKVANDENYDSEGILLLGRGNSSSTPYGLDMLVSAVIIRTDRSIQNYFCEVVSPEQKPGLQFKKITCFPRRAEFY